MEPLTFLLTVVLPSAFHIPICFESEQSGEPADSDRCMSTSLEVKHGAASKVAAGRIRGSGVEKHYCSRTCK